MWYLCPWFLMSFALTGYAGSVRKTAWRGETPRRSKARFMQMKQAEADVVGEKGPLY